MKKRNFLIFTILVSLLFTSCLAEILNNKFGYTVPVSVYYHTDLGEEPNVIQLTPGTALTAQELPTLQYEGDVFEGWYLENYTVKVEPGFIVNEDIELWAKWRYYGIPECHYLVRVFKKESNYYEFELDDSYSAVFNRSIDADNYIPALGSDYDYIPFKDFSHYEYDFSYSGGWESEVLVIDKYFYNMHITSGQFSVAVPYLPSNEGFTYTFYIDDSSPTISNIASASAPYCDLHFENCTSTSFNTIGSYAFTLCTWLKGIYLPSTITKIDDHAFSGCNNLENVYFQGNNLTNIGQDAFNKCYKLKQIDIPSSVKTIGSYAFEWCTSLTEVKLPKNSEYQIINSGLFFNCKELTTVYIPASITYINPLAFDETKLSQVYYGGTMTQKLGITIDDGTIKGDSVHWDYEAY